MKKSITLPNPSLSPHLKPLGCCFLNQTGFTHGANHKQIWGKLTPDKHTSIIANVCQICNSVVVVKSLSCDKNYRTDKLYKNNANMFMNVHLGMNYKKKHNSTRQLSHSGGQILKSPSESQIYTQSLSYISVWDASDKRWQRRQ